MCFVLQGGASPAPLGPFSPVSLVPVTVAPVDVDGAGACDPCLQLQINIAIKQQPKINSD